MGPSCTHISGGAGIQILFGGPRGLMCAWNVLFPAFSQGTGPKSTTGGVFVNPINRNSTFIAGPSRVSHQANKPAARIKAAPMTGFLRRRLMLHVASLRPSVNVVPSRRFGS